MGKMDELVRKIEDDNKQDEQNKIDIEKNKKEWLKSLFELFEEIKIWLLPLINKKLVSLKENVIDLTEELTGSYKAPMLEIHGQKWTIILKPVGRYIIGARGRIDILCGPKGVMLILHKDGWKLSVKKDRGFDYKQLTEDLFAEIIEELTL